MSPICAQLRIIFSLPTNLISDETACRSSALRLKTSTFQGEHLTNQVHVTAWRLALSLYDHVMTNNSVLHLLSILVYVLLNCVRLIGKSVLYFSL
jgi:hypothetical protein